MNYERTLIKFLKRVVLEGKPRDTSFSSFSAILSGPVPEELLPLKAEHRQLIITGQKCLDFYSVLNELRKDISTEYLRDKELHQRLWCLLCEIELNKDLYKKNLKLVNAKASYFLSELCQPIDEFEVMFKIQNFDIAESPISLWDCSLCKFDAEQLSSWGLKSSGLHAGIFNEFVNQTLVIVNESGNNQSLVIERAREKAVIRLKALQIALSDSHILHDENLLFEYSGYAASRKTNDPSSTTWIWKRKREPISLRYGEKLENCLEKANQHLSFVQSFRPGIKDRIEKAIYWIGRSIDEAEPDQKVIALCSAMEALLTVVDDEKKGEAIAYRMVLLNSLLEEAFLDPSRILWIYELRCKVIHGSSRGEATMAEYYTMLLCARETLYNFVRFVNKEKVEEISRFIAKLESSEKVKSVLEWLEKRKGEKAKAIRSALEKATSGK